MAIKIENPQEGKLNMEIDNGHAAALKKIVKDYNLKSEKEAIIFMLGLLSEAEGRPVEIAGNKYMPPDNFRNDQ